MVIFDQFWPVNGCFSPSLRDVTGKIFNVTILMQTADFDFELPPELIAQFPAERRDASRLLVLDRRNGQISHRLFPAMVTFLNAGDVLVLNNSRVIPARLRGTNEKTGGKFELLLLEENAMNDWWVMLRPGKRAPIGTRIVLLDHAHEKTSVLAEVIGINDEGHRRIRFRFANDVPATLDVGRSRLDVGCSEVRGSPNLLNILDQLGELPLPPYIERLPGPSSECDLERYQTVFAEPPGSVAAPTAGLHFTPAMFDTLRARGVTVEFITLHVGLGTFAPVKAEKLSQHVMHEERFNVSEAAAATVSDAKLKGHRIVAVGTTTMRVLETVARANGGRLIAGSGRTRIFIHPPQTFSLVDALLTNFHLPCSTLLMLVSAFAAPGELRGRELVLRAYAEAVRERYRFFSYGDAMFIA
jgi:S-adenosylmethionine:tRNA ribosyltransferase-isomerase